MLLASTAFVYRKYIIEGIIGAGALSLVPSASAQRAFIGAGGEGESWPALSEGSARISANPGLLGFELRGRVVAFPENCSDAVSPFFMTAFILSDISDEDFYIKMNRCLREQAEGHKWVVGFGPLQIPLTEAEKKEVEKIHQALALEVDHVEERLARIQNSDFSKDITEASVLVNLLQDRNDLGAKVYKAYVYASLGNLGKAQEAIESYLDEVEYELYFANEYPYHTAADRKKRIAVLAGELQKLMGKSRIFDAFLLKLYGEASDQTRQHLRSEANIALREKQAMSIVKSPSLGERKPLAWTAWARQNLGQAKQQELFAQIPASSEIGSLQVLRYFAPSTSEKRAKFAKAFEGLEQTRRPAHRVLYFKIMENERWSEYLASLDRPATEPLFKRKRDFYLEALNSGKGTLFPVYNLFALGDFQREYFIKVLAVRIHGLPATQILPL